MKQCQPNFNLRVFGITSGSDLLLCSLSEADCKDSQHVSISSLCLYEGLNQSVPFLHQLADLVLCHVHAVEVCVAIVALDFLNLDLHFSPVFIIAFVLQVS